MKYLNYDSGPAQFILKLCNACLLNLLWFLCSLPIFTVGASTAAVYYVSLKMVRGESVSALPLFFKSFRENFKQATVLWLILLGAGLFIGGDGWILWHLRQSSTGPLAVVWTLLLAIVIAAAVVFFIVLIYVFPLVASVSNTNRAMLKNSFLIGTHYLFCTILVFAIHFAVFFIVVSVFTPLIIFGEGLCALLSSYLLNHVIAECSYDPDRNAVPESDPENGTENS